MENNDFIIEDNILVKYCGNASDVVIPQGVTEIGQGAFKEYSLIKHVNIPNTVTKIGKGSFCRCEGLVDVIIPDSVTHIGAYAFAGCKSLTNVELSDNLERIDFGAFKYCESLRFIEIPNSVKGLGNDVFFYCRNMEHVEISNDSKWIGFGTFTFDRKEFDEPRDEYISNFTKLGKVKAYMPFWSDWTCKHSLLDDTKYEIGKKYFEEDAEYRKQGFHAYIEPLHIFEDYRGITEWFHFAEVELSGKFDFKRGVVVGSEMKIIRELSFKELVDIFNQPNNSHYIEYLQIKKNESK
jgi:hypothetical protein